MKKTILSHIYNEEYLLPYWLKHHKKYFDHGIIIDYNSTDRSIEIIKEICPTWEIHTTKNQYFYAPDVEPEIVEYEKNIEGFRMVLNTTEFLFGNYEKLNYLNENKQYFVRSHIMVDSPDNLYKDINKNLFKERQYGIHGFKEFDYGNERCDRACRSLHNYLIDYTHVSGPGRHFRTSKENWSKDFFILWYGFSPWNENIIKRKLQIQTKHHPSGDWSGGHNLSREQLDAKFLWFLDNSEDLSNEINKLL
jgi:hypothetical protein